MRLILFRRSRTRLVGSHCCVCRLVWHFGHGAVLQRNGGVRGDDVVILDDR